MVANLAGGPGDQAILPHKPEIFQAASSLKFAELKEKRLGAIQTLCPSQKAQLDTCKQKGPESARRCSNHQALLDECARDISPSFINYSMSLETTNDYRRVADSYRAFLASPPQSEINYKLNFPELSRKDPDLYKEFQDAVLPGQRKRQFHSRTNNLINRLKASENKSANRLAERFEEFLASPPQSEGDYKTRFPALSKYDPNFYKNFEDINAGARRAVRAPPKWRMQVFRLMTNKNDIDRLEDIPQSESSFSSLTSLARHSVVTASAGNLAPQPISDGLLRASRESGVILVGSLDPDGRKSAFSQEHEEVAIMAPAGYDIYSLDSEGEPQRFGGTSAAAPLVTASLAGFEWLSGYHPTAQEAKLLLEQTAIPIEERQPNQPRTNGAGMLNSYKLGMVGERLRRKCGTNRDCFRQGIRDPATYKFPQDTGLTEAVESAFPQCSASCGGVVDNSCQAKEKALKRLRQAMFLNPSVRENHALLACVYNSNGFLDASQSAQRSYKALFGPDYGEPLYGQAQKDSDCVLVPNDQNPGAFRALTEGEADLYCATRPGGPCGCAQGQQTARMKNKTPVVYSASAKSGRCALSEKTMPSELNRPWRRPPPRRLKGKTKAPKNRPLAPESPSQQPATGQR